jgi:hypothetical protein
MRQSALALAATLILGVCGCNGDSSPVMNPVHGRVLFNGRPTANAQVTFHPINDNGPKVIRPVGRVDEQGNFTLTSFKDSDGAPAGEYQVTVVWFLARPARAGSDETTSANYLPEKYSRAETSKLKATVAPGTNDIPAFELK